MRKAFFPAILLIVFFFSFSQVFAKIGFGIRGGRIHNNKEGPMAGAHINWGAYRTMDVELSFEYAWREFWDYATLKDHSINATVKCGLFRSEIKPDLGVGVGRHSLTYDWEGGPIPTCGIKDENCWALHALLGVALKSHLFPFEVFAEGKYVRYVWMQVGCITPDCPVLLIGVTFKL